MIAPKLYVGAAGVVVTIELGEDITAASTVEVELFRPDGTRVTIAAGLSGTTALQFTTAVDTFTLPGPWGLQPLVTMPTGQWAGNTCALLLYARGA